jgi:hypothetical protein
MRRLAAGLSLSVVSVFLPVVAGPAGPHIKHWRIGLPADGAVTAPAPFGLVGVAWPAASRTPDGVEVKLPGRPWTGLDADNNEGPDGGSPVRATLPLWVGRATRVQIRFTGPRPAGAAVHLIDPGPDPSSVLRPASAEPGDPHVISRSEWGADESIKRCCVHYASDVRVAFVHHTVTGNNYGPGDSAAIVRSIYAYHVLSNGWDDIGYNFLVDRFGRVFEGRAGGIHLPVIGAHAQGFNTGSTGASMIGTFSSSSPPAEAMDALVKVLAWKLDVHHIDPQGGAVMTSRGSSRWPEGSQVSLKTISAHRDVGQTECPGDQLYGALDDLRIRVATTGLPKLYAPGIDRAAFTPNGDGVADTATSFARGASSSTWTVDVLDAAGAVRRTAAGTGQPSFAWDGKDTTGVGTGHGYYRLRMAAQDSGGARSTPADVGVLLAAWPDGSIVKGSKDAVYRVNAGRLDHVAGPAIFSSWFRWNEIARVPDPAIDAYTQGPALGFRDGTLVRTPDGKVWLLSEGRRRHIQSPDDFVRLGFRWDAIVDVPAEEAAVDPAGAPVDATARTHPNGALVKGSGPAVYWIQNGLRRHVPSPAIFSTWFRWNEVAQIADDELLLYPPGPDLTFRDGTLVRIPGDPHVWVVSDGARRHIQSPETFAALAYDWANILTVDAADAATAPEGPPV